jgi:DNA-binding MarR family transcriptional regulator
VAKRATTKALEQPSGAKRNRLRVVASYVADTEAKEFDRLIYEKIRLGIMSALSVNRSMTFGELKELLNTTDGNLSVHSRKLEDAGYVAVRKRFEGRVPKTEYSLTAEGKRVFSRYLKHMEALINAARG